MPVRKVVINHDGGAHNVEAVTNSDGTVSIYFGASFTLRVDEENVDKLRYLISEVSRDLMISRAASQDEQDTVELPRGHETSRGHVGWTEDEFIQDGIDAREKLKVARMMKGTASPISNDPIDW
tara:strand:+ start:173 stop:544 length:372 start_codon:yes stop_codon:yes gene_type:complete